MLKTGIFGFATPWTFFGGKVAGLILIRFSAEALRFSFAKTSLPLKYENVRSNQPVFHVSSGFRYLPPQNLDFIVHIQMWTKEIEVP